MKGLDALNINMICPFQVQDYLLGFRMKLDGSLKKAPESLFIKKSVDLENYIAGAGSVSIDTDYDVQNMVSSLILLGTSH